MAAEMLDAVSVALDSVPSRRERLQRAFQELELQRQALSSCTVEWKQIEEHLGAVEKALSRRHEEITAREAALDARERDREEAFCRREEAIAAREGACLRRLQEQREVALAAIAEEKRKWAEERYGLEHNHDNAQKLEEAMPHEETGAEQQVAYAYNNTTAESPKHQQQHQDSGNSSSKELTPSPSSQHTMLVTANNGAVAATEVRVRPELKALCEDMDGEGLRKYVSEHRKDTSALRMELPLAVQCAIDPAQLVLDAVEGYNLAADHSSSLGGGDGNGSSSGEGKKECGASANRRACILILESVISVLALGSDHLKSRAKKLADSWKSRMDVLKEAAASASENSLDVQAFLQLVATYGISSEYDDEELSRLVIAVARRRQSPALCRALGLSYKIPEMVDKLARAGKQIEALAFAHAFEMMERVQPVPMLKAYLKESRRTADLILRNGGCNSAAAQNDSSMKELSALKSVLKCIEEYNLETEFPPQPLQKRVELLERAKADRKRAAVAVKAQTKRPRATAGNYGERNLNLYVNYGERPQYGGSTYGCYERAGFSAAAYVSSNRPAMSMPYVYPPPDGHASSLYSSPAYANPPSFSSFQFGSGLPPPPPAYQASFLH